MATSKRKKLTIAEKVKIIQEVEKNPSTPAIEIAQKFNLAPSSFFCVMKNKQLILDEEVKCGGEAIKRKNIKSSPYDEVEKILIQWFEGMCSAILPINSVLLKEKAIRVASRLRIENLKRGMKNCLKIYVNFEIIFCNHDSLQKISLSIAIRLACHWNLFLNVYFKNINISIVHTKLKNGFLL